ncbi:MAG: 23S rRNA (adenine(2503)-C(2))-methyltransferase RlmN [Nitrospirae bacterium]|nr:MAG: 23S rRNA (adenine(2503)-C(2))-methyltransferase RlmN [Nitrospirota bacterium]
MALDQDVVSRGGSVEIGCLQIGLAAVKEGIVSQDRQMLLSRQQVGNGLPVAPFLELLAQRQFGPAHPEGVRILLDQSLKQADPLLVIPPAERLDGLGETSGRLHTGRHRRLAGRRDNLLQQQAGTRQDSDGDHAHGDPAAPLVRYEGGHEVWLATRLHRVDYIIFHRLPRIQALCYALPVMSTTDLMTLSAGETADLVRDKGWPRFHTHQILRWLYQHRVTDVEAMTDLSKAVRMQLSAETRISALPPVETLTSEDGTQKFIFHLEDGKAVESVLIPNTSSRENDRLTLCLSTQVGCTLDCAFCLTGRMGLLRNLKAHEIVGQVLAVQRGLAPGLRLTNLVLMGMGEPLANADAVEEAVRRLTNQPWGVGLSPRRITLSTAGLTSRLTRVAKMGVNLAVSLNATTNEQRDRLMPAVNKAYPLQALMKACRAFPLKPHRRMTFEYVLLRDENDSAQDAARLVKLIRGMRCKINLIPFNEFPGSPFRRPADETVLRFQAIVTKNGVDAYIRKSKGRDILGACGQLGTLSESLPLIPVPQRCSTA